MSFELERRFRRISDNDIDSKVGVSLFVDYIPFYAVHAYNSTVTGLQRYSESEFEYPVFKNKGESRISRYADLFSYLNGDSQAKSVAYSFKNKDDDYTAYVSHGIMRDDSDNILLALAIQRDYFQEFYNAFSNSVDIDYSKLTLFVANDFITNQKYSYLWKKVEKEYYYGAIEKGCIIEVRDSSYIESILFQDGINVKFDNLTEFHQFLNDSMYNTFVEEMILIPVEDEEDYYEDDDYENEDDDFEEDSEDDEIGIFDPTSDDSDFEQALPVTSTIINVDSVADNERPSVQLSDDGNTFTIRSSSPYVVGIDPITPSVMSFSQMVNDDGETVITQATVSQDTSEEDDADLPF